MKNKLTIELEADDESLLYEYRIKINDKQIGCVQEINLHIDSNSEPKVEMVFPDLTEFYNSSPLPEQINTYIETLRKLECVGIRLVELDHLNDKEQVTP